MFFLLGSSCTLCTPDQEMGFFQFLLLVLLYISPLVSTTPKFDTTGTNYSIMKADVITIRPECQSKCGYLVIPYPFGIDKSCAINPTFVITCDETTDPPKAFLMGGTVQVYDVSNTQLRRSNSVAFIRYDQSGKPIVNMTSFSGLGSTTYMYSDDNVFTVVGCDDFGKLYNEYSSLPKGCSTTCDTIDEVPENGDCLGSGCCQVPINLLNSYTIVLDSYNNHRDVSSFSDSGYAFMGERGRFNFRGKSDLIDSNFRNRTMDTVPVVLDWVIGFDNCTEAAKEKKSSVCYKNSKCVDGNRYRGYKGYRCECNEGYEGNPYLERGCQDID